MYVASYSLPNQFMAGERLMTSPKGQDTFEVLYDTRRKIRFQNSSSEVKQDDAKSDGLAPTINQARLLPSNSDRVARVMTL